MNNVTGWTASPFNRLLTCGGSSGGQYIIKFNINILACIYMHVRLRKHRWLLRLLLFLGEGALVGLQASPLGVGTDIGNGNITRLFLPDFATDNLNCLRWFGSHTLDVQRSLWLEAIAWSFPLHGRSQQCKIFFFFCSFVHSLGKIQSMHHDPVL